MTPRQSDTEELEASSETTREKPHTLVATVTTLEADIGSWPRRRSAEGKARVRKQRLKVWQVCTGLPPWHMKKESWLLFIFLKLGCNGHIT